MTQPFRVFLAKSYEFCQALYRDIDDIPFTDENEYRILSVLVMLDISSEHGQAIHRLAESGLFISATSLLRLQYEATIRAFWLYYCAKEKIINKLQQPLTEQNVKQFENITPTITIMLEEIEKGIQNQSIPNKAYVLLKGFKDLHFKHSCSYVHSGLHAFNRKKEGFPEPLMIQLLQNSNGLEAINAMLLATMSQSMQTMSSVLSMQYLYLDCLPMQIPEIMHKFYFNNAGDFK